jgi:hypothetical protein
MFYVDPVKGSDASTSSGAASIKQKEGGGGVRRMFPHLPFSGFFLFLSGTEASPFKTVSRAVEQTRTVTGKSSHAAITGTGAATRATIVLRMGTHYLTDTIELNHADSGLAIVNYQVVPGGAEVKLFDTLLTGPVSLLPAIHARACSCHCMASSVLVAALVPKAVFIPFAVHRHV